jgi:putative ABC transport system permease protein
MTVIGITGCTSLLVCGFAIKDSVGALMPRQYEYIVHYDWMAVTEADDHDGLCGILDQMPEIRSYLELDVESVTVRGPDGSTEIIQLYVVPDSSSLEDYVLLKDISSGAPLQPGPDGIIVTRNASVILSFEAGDTISLQDLHFRQHDFKVSAITENYLGNAVYMTRDLYERTFGKFEANAVLAIYREGTDPDETARILEQNDIIRTSVSTSDLKSQFEAAFTLINVVVYLLIVMAAALAFVVLFTLASTNISERERELATIKVLGFYDREVHLYVNKETLILTGFGILLGMPTGALYAHALTPILRMPSLYFAVSIRPFSFVLSAALALLFALLVNRMTDRTLNGIDPAEALKSIE